MNAIDAVVFSASDAMGEPGQPEMEKLSKDIDEEARESDDVIDKVDSNRPFRRQVRTVTPIFMFDS